MYVPYVPYIVLVPIWYQYLSDNCDLDRRSHPITLTFVLIPLHNLSELLLSTPSGHESQTSLTISLTIRLGDTNLHEYPIRSNTLPFVLPCLDLINQYFIRITNQFCISRNTVFHASQGSFIWKMGVSPKCSCNMCHILHTGSHTTCHALPVSDLSKIRAIWFASHLNIPFQFHR
jgi:hypothetical protein